MLGYYGDHMFGWGIWGAFMMLIFWAVVIAFIIWIAREASGRHSSHGTRQDSALNILRERYAKGEISKEEFETKKEDIGV